VFKITLKFQEDINKMGRQNKSTTRQGFSKAISSSPVETKAYNIKSSSHGEPTISKQEYVLAFLVFLSTLVVYKQTMHPSLPGGDSGELIIAAHEFGVAHPPGYPLFTMLARLSMTLSPLTSIAWRVNLMSALFGSLCSAFIFLTTYRLSHDHSAGLLASLMFTFSRLVWTWSVCAEVFALNNLLIIALLYTASVFDSCDVKDLQKISCIGAFICGLCLTNQHTSILYIGVIVPWVFYRLWNHKMLDLPLLLRLILMFILGLLPYIYLPISSYFRVARWTWGDHTSLGGFLTHLLRREYGTLDLLKDHTGQGFASGLWAFIMHSWKDLTPPICFLFAASTCQTIFRLAMGGYKSLTVLLHAMLWVYLAFFCWRANLDISNPLFFRVVERFWIQSDLVICILAALYYGELTRVLEKYTKKSVQTIGAPIAVIAIGFQLSQTWQSCDQSSNYVIKDFALQNLNSFPNGSIILTEGDLPSNSFRYFHLCEGVRSDLSVIDQEILTYSWALPMLGDAHPDMVIPGDKWQPYSGVTPEGLVAFTFKDLIDANYKSHQMFACIGVQKHEGSWKQGYVLFPFGVCSKIVDSREILSVDGWARETEGLTRDWNYTLNRKADGSWEHVANEEMWRGRTTTGLFYLEQALKPENGQVAEELLLKAYEIYNQEISKHTIEILPAFWHRNFAIVCDRLSQLSTDLSHRELIINTVQHFRQYTFKMEPDDPDGDRIKDAVVQLQEYLDKQKEGES